jgi:hypothetical protein
MSPEPPINPIRRSVGYGFAAAIVVAPFLALVVDLGFGLLVMAVALGATGYLAVDAARLAPAPRRRRLLVLTAVNAALAVACLIGAVWRI